MELDWTGVDMKMDCIGICWIGLEFAGPGGGKVYIYTCRN
jgi:hypothetical protein